MSFNLKIKNSTFDRNFFSRLISSYNHIPKNNSTISSIIQLTVPFFALGASSWITYFCYKGCYISTKETGLSKYGNIFGWSVIPLISLEFMFIYLQKLMAEGDYFELLDLLKETKINHPDIQFEESLLRSTISDFSNLCLFPKTNASKEHFIQSLLDQNGTAGALFKLKNKIKKATRLTRIVQRTFNAIHVAYKKNGITDALIMKISGMGLPLFFVASSVGSAVGLRGLVSEVAKGIGIGETGHVGEWLFNILAAFGTAYLLFVTYLCNLGDYLAAKGAIDKFLIKLKDSNSSYYELVLKESNEYLMNHPGHTQYQRLFFDELPDITVKQINL